MTQVKVCSSTSSIWQKRQNNMQSSKLGLLLVTKTNFNKSRNYPKVAELQSLTQMMGSRQKIILPSAQGVGLDLETGWILLAPSGALVFIMV